jgi:hypothetical protein
MAGALTAWLHATDNADVVPSVRPRRLVASVAVFGILGLALLPSEHIHSSRVETGRHADVVHRHFPSHHAAHPATVGLRSDDHDDDVAQWLTQSFVSPRIGSMVHPDMQWMADTLALLQSQEVSGRIVPSTYVSVHDPPWAAASGLRAPPSLLV